MAAIGKEETNPFTVSSLSLLSESGIDVALIGYQLCPESSMTGIVNQIRTALIWLWRKCSQLCYLQRDRINISGHSAGGHITGMILATDWQKISSELPKDLSENGYPN